MKTGIRDCAVEAAGFQCSTSPMIQAVNTNIPLGLLYLSEYPSFKLQVPLTYVRLSSVNRDFVDDYLPCVTISVPQNKINQFG